MVRHRVQSHKEFAIEMAHQVEVEELFLSSISDGKLKEIIMSSKHAIPMIQDDKTKNIIQSLHDCAVFERSARQTCFYTRESDSNKTVNQETFKSSILLTLTGALLVLVTALVGWPTLSKIPLFWRIVLAIIGVIDFVVVIYLGWELFHLCKKRRKNKNEPIRYRLKQVFDEPQDLQPNIVENNVLLPQNQNYLPLSQVQRELQEEKQGEVQGEAKGEEEN